MPEGSSGLTGPASSSSRPAAAPGRSCRATAVLRSPLGLPREKGCWGHLGLAALRQPSHMPLEGSASCPVTFLQSRGPAHRLDCPALLPSSTQAPPMTPSQPLCVRPWPWGRDAHLLGSAGWGSRVDRSLQVELRALEVMGWSGCPPPNVCSKGGWRPRSWRGFSGRGAVDGAPSSCLGPTVHQRGAAARPRGTPGLRATGEAAKRLVLTLVWIRALQRCRRKPSSSGSWRPGSPGVQPGLPERL